MRIRGASAVLAGLALLAGCSHPASTSDPGNRKLDVLRADPVFTGLPDGAESVGPVVASPARNRASGLDGGGQDAPSVAARFSSTAAPAAVFAFYARRTAAGGWAGVGRNATGRTNSWRKTYPGGFQAGLLLLDLDQRLTSPGTAHRYTLTAGIDGTRKRDQ